MNATPYTIDFVSLPEIVPLGPDECFVTEEVSDGSSITVHRHSFIELIYFTEGYGRQSIDDMEFPIEPGTVCLLLPSNVHEIMPEIDDPPRQRRCAIDPSVLMKLCDDGRAVERMFSECTAASQSFLCTAGERVRFEELFDSLEDQSPKTAFGCVQMTYIAVELIIFFLRRQAEHDGSEERTDAQKWFWKLYHGIFECSHDPSVSADCLAAEFGYPDGNAVEETIRLHVDMSFAQLLRYCRVNESRSLLLAFPEKTTAEISKAAGFSSNAAFFRAFSESYGMTPGAFKEQYLFRTTKPNVCIVPKALSNDIIVYVYEHYREDLKLASLASRFGVNAAQLGREFRLYLETSFSDFVSRVRVAASLALLGSTNYPVKMVAEQAGFGSVQVFMRTFKKMEGCTPTEYRKVLSDGKRTP